MDSLEILDGKTVLLVDDEVDILETLEEMLFQCRVDSALSFDRAVDLLRDRSYDVAVLDIMGVQGFELLKITHRKEIPTLMLTAHALTPENLRQSMEKGADAYVPKDKMADLPLFMADVLKARSEGKRANAGWFSFLEPAFEKVFGRGWRKNDETFWDEFDRDRNPGP